MRCNFELWLFDEFIRHLFWSSEEHPSEDQLVNEKGRSVYVHQPLLLFCGAISHICYCLQTLYFFKVGPVPRVLRIEGVERNCDQDLDKNALELLKALVRSPIPSRQFSPCFDWSFAGSDFYGSSRKCLQVTWFCSRHFAPFHWQRDGTHSFHCFVFEFLNRMLQTCFASAIEGLFELCLRIRVFAACHFCAFLNTYKMHQACTPIPIQTQAKRLKQRRIS